MLPTAYEFHWDLGHLVFLGIFYGVVCVVLGALGYAAYRAWRDLSHDQVSDLAWKDIFTQLPPERRVCRHGLVSHLESRLCEHGFDCGTCLDHPSLARECELPAACRATESGGEPDLCDDQDFGLAINDKRLYHRGHSWAEPQPDGTWTVGLDGFLKRCLGGAQLVALPVTGQTVQAGEHCITVKRGSLSVRVPAPVTGEVIALSNDGDGWLYRMRPAAGDGRPENLLQGTEARLWMLREWEWLQSVLAQAAGTATMADGGTPVADLVQAYPRADWDGIWGMICLDT